MEIYFRADHISNTGHCEVEHRSSPIKHGPANTQISKHLSDQALHLQPLVDSSPKA